MQAYTIKAPEKLELTKKEYQVLKPNEVHIKITLTNICGSDIKNFYSPRKLDIVIGHEASGTVIECGKNVKTIFSGDRVSIFPIKACFNCIECLNNNHRDCLRKQAIGFDLDGTYASSIVTDYRTVIPLNKKINDLEAANIEPLACSNRLVKELISNRVMKSDKILIIGDGPIAIGNILLLRLYGFRNIILVGKYSYRMKIAESIPCNTIHFSEIENYIKKENQIKVIIYSANAPDTLNTIMKLFNNKILISPQVRLPKNIETDFNDLIYFSRAFAYKYSDFEDIKSFFNERAINIDTLITNEIKFGDLNNFKSIIMKKDTQLKTTVRINI